VVVLVFGTLRFPPENMDQVRSPLRDLVEATIRLDGCIAYDVAEDMFDPGLLRFSEIWPNRESLERRLQTPHILPWRQASARLELSERNFTAFDGENARSV